MGKRIKNCLLICLCGVLFGFMPMMVDAASFKLDKNNIEKESNLVKLPIYIVLEESETINLNDSFALSCETDDIDVTCEIELTDNKNFISQDNSFWFHNTEGPLGAGEHQVATMILTNNANSKKGDVQVKNINGNIKNSNKTIESFSTSIGAKPEVKTESNDAFLGAVEINVGTMVPDFNKDVFEYTIYGIKDTISKIKFTPTCNDKGTCSYELTGGKSRSGNTITLDLGENKVILDVTSEDGENTKSYIFNVIRGETTFNSAELASLTFGDYELSPEFKGDTTKYTITVPNEVTSLAQIIKYDPADSNAKEKIEVKGLDNLKVGENKLTIAVTNANEDQTITYEVVVTRLSEENIEILSYINNEITFKDNDGIQTTLKEEEFKTLYPNEYQKIKNNEYKFDEKGNKVVEGLEEEEEENEDKKDKEKNNKIWIIVLLIVIGLVVIIVSGILIFRKKKPAEEELPSNEKEEKKESDEDEINEEGVEEKLVGKDFSKDIEATVDIDEALSDLMNTKQYTFQDEINKKLKENDKDED